MTPLRVLVDVSAVADEPAGTAVYVTNLTRALAAGRQVELHLLARHGDRSRWRSIAQGARVHAVVPITGPAPWTWDRWGRRRFLRHVAVDVWHGPDAALPPIGSPDVSSVVTVHDLTVIEHPEMLEEEAARDVERRLRSAVKAADVVVAVSNDTAARVHDRLHPTAPVIVAPFGVDAGRFRPASTEDAEQADAAALASHGVRAPFVGFVGTLEPRKNVPTLVDAFARVAAKRPDLGLAIAGRAGWRADEVTAAVSECGVGDRIVVLGYAPAEILPPLYRAAEVVVHPSSGEGFGLPALEALACAAPLVTTQGSAMQEIAENAAVLVRPGDVGELAGAIERVLDDRRLRDRLRTEGPRVAGRFSWGRCARAHLDAYQLAVGGRRALGASPAP